MFKIDIVPSGVLLANAIIVGDLEARKMWLFDAPDGIGKILEAYKSLELQALFLTHAHFDHILGIPEINPPRIYAGRGDRTYLSRAWLMKGWVDDPDLKDRLESVAVTDWIDKNQTIELGGLEIEVRLVPGHSKGGLIYYLPALKTALVGDTLFKGSIGRTDMPGGDTEESLKSIREQILTLPDQTRLIPGHGPTTTVGEEKAGNPYI